MDNIEEERLEITRKQIENRERIHGKKKEIKEIDRRGEMDEK